MGIALTGSWMRCAVAPILASAWLLVPAKATAERTNSLDALKSQYEAARLDIGHACAEREKDALKQYGKALDCLLAALKQKGDLDAYLVVDREGKRFSAEKTGPTNDVPDLAAVVQPYRTAVALADADMNRRTVGLLRQYVTALNGLIAKLVRADKIEAAKDVKAERDKAAFELADLEAKMPPEEKPAATDEAASPAKTPFLPASLNKGLVLYYSFDKNEGGKVTDGSGRKNVGEMKGAKWVAEGRIGAACSFDGRSDYLSCPNAALKSLQNHSVCFWVCRTGDGCNWPRFFLNGVVNTSITITQAGVDREIVYRFSAKGVNDDLTTDSLPLVNNEWVHIACTYDGKVRKIYKNGVKIAEKTGAVRIAVGKGNLAYVGGSEHIQASSFAGKLDEVMVFDRALSENEVSQLSDGQK